MGFRFTLLFVKASTEATRNDPDARVVTRWFAQHGKRLRDKDTDQLAVLSCMFPEKRTDRVYGLQDLSLARVIGRCLLLGSSRREELEQWRQSGGVDLGQCVENVMRQAENHIIPGQEITVEDIDEALNRIASRCRFSGPSVRRRQRGAVDVEEALSPMYRRLGSRDAKWLTRMILKSFAPVILPLPLTLRGLHFLLPHLLMFQDSFEAALSTLASQPMCNFPPHPDPGLARSLRLIALQHLTPRMGVKIGRPEYYKARSIKHCCQMIGQRRISMERKYDGEYCQIHIDLSTHPSIQIFSKSGKDSTVDRSGIHDVLKEALRIGSSECKFSSRCILEGELLVWSDKNDKIMDFHKLRKFISRSGTFIGTENDSPPQPDEHLMIVFFDILLLDDNVCLRKPHRDRRLLLKEVIQIIHGRAGISDQQVLDFSHPGSRSNLESIFAKGVSNKWEGFVLKGCEDPYFTIMSSTNHAPSGRWIKLKKDYIPGLGDTVDLALVGGAYDAHEAAALDSANKVLWTRFFIGCLTNKDAVLQWNAVPKFRIVDTINRHCMSIQNMHLLNQLGEYSACSPESGHGFNIESGHGTLPSMDSVFRKPFVVEMLGSGFEKPSGARYFALRFPRILKVHSDRTFEDAASFGELQVLAERARSLVLEDMAQDESEWSKRLKLGNGSTQYITNRSQSTSSSQSSHAVSFRVGQHSNTGIAHPSPDNHKRPSQSTRETHVQTGNIPIYVDGNVSPDTSFVDTESQGHLLKSNVNLTQRDWSRRKESVSAGSPGAKTKDHEAEVSRAIPSTPKLTHAPSPSSPLKPMQEPSQSRQTKKPPTAQTLPKKQTKPIKSPLTTIPILYTPQDPTNKILPPNNHHHFPNLTSNPSVFFQNLESAQIPAPHPTPTSPPNQPSTGILLTNPCPQNPLGPTLFTLIKALSHKVRTAPPAYPRSGKIFVLAPDFLAFSTGPADARFCLRSTWENIGREFFYACVSWSTGAGKNHSCLLAAGGVGSESTECEGSCCAGLFKVSVGFDRRALGCLGDGCFS
ncbi:ATP dependent DNA ligase domain protein [Aspergillus candidus]|uniref:ATP-dependent DNA ligase family profile domain-containing protein n=1 Tax=Aspergillus candidus TaxID=41067 RepID=A0A2I2FNP7_ASPCN|nr:hypothetical protein BDW47DRAFT_131468 [Aspergillus candidus]PLB42238.1 hypothetical protein BDW47DRAFT_131468 [Aspergillus candidus]